MEAAQLSQLSSKSQTINNSAHQPVKDSNQESGFLEKLNNAAAGQKEKREAQQLLNQNEVDSGEDLEESLSQKEIEKLQKLLGGDSNLELDSTELKKLQKLLAKDGFELTDEELKELLDSIGGIYQQLMQLDISKLSSLSEADKTKLKQLKSDLLKTAKEFKLQLKNLKEIDSKQLELLQQFKSDQQQSSKEQQKLKDVKQLKENLLQKLAELKKVTSKLQKQKLAGPKADQQKQQVQEISKLLDQLNNHDSKLSKLLQKYGITGKQVETTQQNQADKLRFNGHFKQQLSKEQAETKGESNSNSKAKSNTGKSLLKQLAGEQNKNSKGEKIKVSLTNDKQKLKAEDLNSAKVNIEDQMRAKNNVVRQNIINSDALSVNTKMQQVDQTKVVNQVLQQLEQLKSLGKNELTLKLEPDSLGKVNLKMAISDGVLSTKVMTENYQVKKAIEAQLHQLKNALTEKNLEVGEIAVEVGSEDEFSSFQEQESFTQQEFSGRQQNRQAQQEMDPELLMELGEIEGPIEEGSAVDSSLAVDSIDYVI